MIAAVLFAHVRVGLSRGVGLLQLLLLEVIERHAPVVVGFEREKGEAVQHVAFARFGLLDDRLELFLGEAAARLLRLLLVRLAVL